MKALLQISMLSALFFAHAISAISLVYNMKIRRAFAAHVGTGTGIDTSKSHVAATGLPIFYGRERHIIEPAQHIDICERRFTDGILVNLRYINPKHWWLEASTGFEKERVHSTGTTSLECSRFGVDDILLVGGYNFLPTDKLQIVLYGLAGLPTKLTVTAADTHEPLVGTRFFNTGFGGEISYSFINTKEHTFFLLCQNRFIHLFNRTFEPILPPGGIIRPGNLSDFLLAARYRYKKNILETGYNLSVLSNQAIILPTSITRPPNFIRHSYYASYSRLFKELPVIKKPGLLGAGFYLSRAKIFDTRIASCWLNVTVVF